MRLIDADALSVTMKIPLMNVDGRYTIDHWHVTNMIEKALTVDAVPVIRCRDCKHYYEKEWVVGGGSYTTCWYQTIANAQPNDFCSRAERKEE